jgi:membrane fusion protein, multidrug efflux system
VTEGLSPGELVVVEGTERLREGSKVEIKGPGAPSGQGEPKAQGQRSPPKQGK